MYVAYEILKPKINIVQSYDFRGKGRSDILPFRGKSYSKKSITKPS